MSRFFVRISDARVTDGFVVCVVFTNGQERNIDLTPYLRGEIFDRVRSDPDYFRQLAVDRELGTITWPNGADIDPDVLFGAFEPAGQEEPNRVRDDDPGYRSK